MGWLRLKMPGGDWVSISQNGAGPGSYETLRLKLPDGSWVEHVVPSAFDAVPLRLKTGSGWQTVLSMAAAGNYHYPVGLRRYGLHNSTGWRAGTGTAAGSGPVGSGPEDFPERGGFEAWTFHSIWYGPDPGPGGSETYMAYNGDATTFEVLNLDGIRAEVEDVLSWSGQRLKSVRLVAWIETSLGSQGLHNAKDMTMSHGTVDLWRPAAEPTFDTIVDVYQHLYTGWIYGGVPYDTGSGTMLGTWDLDSLLDHNLNWVTGYPGSEQWGPPTYTYHLSPQEWNQSYFPLQLTVTPAPLMVYNGQPGDPAAELEDHYRWARCFAYIEVDIG